MRFFWNRIWRIGVVDKCFNFFVVGGNCDRVVIFFVDFAEYESSRFWGCGWDVDIGFVEFIVLRWLFRYCL